MREGPDTSSSQREGPSTGDPTASACASGPGGRQPNTSASSHVVLRQRAPERRRHRPLLTPICRWSVRLFSRKPSRSHHLLCTLFLLNASCALEMMLFFFGFILPDLRSHIRDVPPSHHKLQVFILEVTNSRFQASDIYVFIVCIFVVQLTYLCLY